jgi:hypothetical protein
VRLALLEWMLRLAGVLVVVLSGAALADRPAPSRPPVAGATKPAVSKTPLRVLRILPNSQQAVLFDKSRNSHVMVEVGTQVGAYTVIEIDDETVTLGARGQQLVLAAPAPAAVIEPTRPIVESPAVAAPAPVVTPTTSDDSAPVDPYADDLGRDTPTRPAPATTNTLPVAPTPVAAPATPAPVTTAAPTTAAPTTIAAPTATAAPATAAPTTAAPTTTDAPTATAAPTTAAPTTAAPTTAAPAAPTAAPAAPTAAPTAPAPAPAPAAPTAAPAAPTTTAAPAAPATPTTAAPAAPTTAAPTTAPAAPTTTAAPSDPYWVDELPVVGAVPAAPVAPSTIGPGPAPAPAPALPTGPLEVSLARTEINAALDDFGGLLASIRGEQTANGVRVDHVSDKSVFAKAGLRTGDLVASVDGKPLRSLDDTAELYARAATARAMTVQVVRGGKPLTIKLVIR